MDRDPRAGTVHKDCGAAVTSAAAMLEGLGHAVEPAWPPALADKLVMREFMAIWWTQSAVARDELAETLGRPVTETDMEGLNWVQAERGSSLRSLDLARAWAAAQDFRRRVSAWRAEGWDLLLRPTLAEPPPPIADFDPVLGNPFAPMRRTVSWLLFTPAVQPHGPAGHQPAPPLERLEPPDRGAARRRTRTRGRPRPGRLPAQGRPKPWSGHRPPPDPA